MGKYNRLGKNTLLIFIGNIGSRIITFVLLPFYTIWFSKGEYGTVDLIFTYVTLLTGVVTCCITESIFRFPKNEPREKQISYFCSGLLFSVICFLLTAIVFFFINTSWKLSENVFVTYIWSIYVIIITNFIQTYLKQFMRSIDKMPVYVFSGIVQTFSLLLFSFILIPNFKTEGYIYTQVISSIITILYIVIWGDVTSYLQWNKVNIRCCVEMLKYALPLIPHSMMWWVLSTLNRPMIETYEGLDALGIFAVASKIPGMISLVFSVFFWSWQISVLEEFDKKDYNVFYNRVFRFIFMCLIVMSFFLTLCSYPIVKLIVDHLYIDAWRYIPILSLGVVFSCLTTLISANFLAAKETKYTFLSTTIGAFVSVVLNFIWIPAWGLMGASVSFTVSFAVMLVVSIFCSKKYVQLKNANYYILSILINLLLIVSILLISSTAYRSLSTFLLMLLFIILNKSDIRKAYFFFKLYLTNFKSKYLSTLFKW